MAREVEQTAGRLGLTPLQAAALLMQGFAMAHQGRSRDAERCLAAAEAAAPGDPDLAAGAWGIGRGIGALLSEDRTAARQAFARAHAEAPDQHARILNPYEGPELLLRALAGRRARPTSTQRPPEWSSPPAGRNYGSAPRGRWPLARRAMCPARWPPSLVP